MMYETMILRPPATRRHRVMPRVESHFGDPAEDGRDAVQNASFDKGHEGCPQNVKQITEIKSRDIVGGDKQHPCDDG